MWCGVCFVFSCFRFPSRVPEDFSGYATFRTLLPTDTQAWNVDLLGEGSIDVGGVVSLGICTFDWDCVERSFNPGFRRLS
jgi:hypothetical protein